MDAKDLSPYLDSILRDATIAELPNHYRGKVRDNYDLPGGKRILIATDRLSAFDIILTAIPLKGQVLTQIARFWFDATSDICPNHVIEYPDPNVVVGRYLKILPVEIVVRDYLAGTTSTSILSMYKAGKREMYGARFPDGLRENQKLPQTIITPTTKAEAGFHDAPITAKEIVDQKILTQAQWDEVSKLALAVFARGREIAAKNGLILVDTKYEFGFDPQTGKITLADEIHTPDSSRYWIAETYQKKFEAGENPDSLDKEFLRLWISARCDPYKDKIPEIPAETLIEFSEKYIRLYEQVTGKKFERAALDTPLRERIKAALKKELPEYFK